MPAMRLPRRSAPQMALVRQNLPSDHIADVRTHTRDALIGAGVTRGLKCGMKIAVTAGSRGIGGLNELLLGISDAVSETGAEPFLIPAMGSHGGGVAEGQEKILRLFGLTSTGIPIRATMDTISCGRAENGAEAHVDRFAAEADGVIVLGRVKTHPESAGELASGLLKMSTIGLGKQVGAYEAHSHNLWDSVRAVPKLQLARIKTLCGVAVVENGFRQPVAVEVVPPHYDAFLEADIRLLRLAKQHLAKIPFDELDVLIVDEIGKSISGAGMDPNVVGHWRISNDAPQTPYFKRIVVLSLTPQSLGNGLGIGFADFTTQRFARAFDPNVTYVNALTASEPGGNTWEASVPLALDSDRDAIEIALFSSLAGPRPRVCRIRNTADLNEIWVSEPLLNEHSELTVVHPLAPMHFDDTGNLF